MEVSIPETFNIAVEDDESYTVGFTTVHNCSICNNEAKSSKFYCTDLKRFMTQYRPQFAKFAYAVNVRPTFFDISDVENPADRIAHYLEYRFGENEMQKAAAAREFVFSDNLAEMMKLKLDTSSSDLSMNQQTLLKKLAALEPVLDVAIQAKAPDAHSSDYLFAKHSARFLNDCSTLREEELSALREIEPDILFAKLASEGAVLPFLDFFAYSTNQTLKLAAADPRYRAARDKHLGTLFRDISSESQDADLADIFNPASPVKIASYSNSNQERLTAQVGRRYSLMPRYVPGRILTAQCDTRSEPLEKSAGIALSPDQENHSKFLARAYGFYKLSTCEAVAAAHGDDFWSDPALLLVLAQN